MAGKVRINGQDFLYIPHSVAADYVSISRYFLKNRVMVELAVYNIQMGLSKLEERKTVHGTNEWSDSARGKYKNNPGIRYNVPHYYLHPLKLARLPQNKNVTEFFL
ncbi:hypothetical protein ACOMHN_042216 [Nucella lapillus]